MDHGGNELDQDQDEAVLNLDVTTRQLNLQQRALEPFQPRPSIWCRRIAAFSASADSATPSPTDQ